MKDMKLFLDSQESHEALIYQYNFFLYIEILKVEKLNGEVANELKD